jgi:signal transduction histidine kinase
MKIAQFHQGHLYAKSKPGEGSVFYILLPEKRK